MKQRIAIFVIASLILPGAHAIESGGPREEYSRENLLSFTRSLIRNGEYYRALHELDRINAYHDKGLEPLVYSVTRDYLLYQGGRFNDLLSGSQREDAPMGRMTGGIFRTDAAFGMGDYRRAGSYLASQETSPDPLFDDMMERRRFFIFVMHDRLVQKETGPQPVRGDFSKYRELMDAARTDLGSLKSPGLAAMLGIIPGMGHVYTGNTGTGIVALIMVSLNAAISYYGFRTGNMPLGIFVGAIGTFFYGGSILGGYLSAGSYNRAAMEGLGNRLGSQLKFGEDRDYLYRKYGLGKYDAQ